MIENGDRRAREYWQKKQLGNLVNHAYLRSEFWRQRIPTGAGRQEVLQNFPILTRKEIAAQVQKEGSIFGDKKQSVETYQTTGSTGTPLKVFVCPQSAYYNRVRGLAQFFIDDLPLDENRVEINAGRSLRRPQENGGVQDRIDLGRPVEQDLSERLQQGSGVQQGCRGSGGGNVQGSRRLSREPQPVCRADCWNTAAWICSKARHQGSGFTNRTFEAPTSSNN